MGNKSVRVLESGRIEGEFQLSTSLVSDLRLIFKPRVPYSQPGDVAYLAGLFHNMTFVKHGSNSITATDQSYHT